MLRHPPVYPTISGLLNCHFVIVNAIRDSDERGGDQDASQAVLRLLPHEATSPYIHQTHPVHAAARPYVLKWLAELRAALGQATEEDEAADLGELIHYITWVFL